MAGSFYPLSDDTSMREPSFSAAGQKPTFDDIGPIYGKWRQMMPFWHGYYEK